MTRRFLSFSCLFLSACCLFVGDTSAQYAGSEWRSHGGDQGGTRYSTLTQINRTNVDKLKKAWTFHTGEGVPESSSAINSGSPAYSGRPTFQCTPLMIDGALYVTTSSSRVIALDPRSRWPASPLRERSGVVRDRALTTSTISFRLQCEPGSACLLKVGARRAAYLGR